MISADVLGIGIETTRTWRVEKNHKWLIWEVVKGGERRRRLRWEGLHGPAGAVMVEEKKTHKNERNRTKVVCIFEDGSSVIRVRTDKVFLA